MPSANLSSGLSPTNALDVFEEFKKKIIINGGRSKIGIESTVIDLTRKPNIWRSYGSKVIKNFLKLDRKKNQILNRLEC